jgi:hypothetical protein
MFAKVLSPGLVPAVVMLALLAGPPAWSQDPAAEAPPGEENTDGADGEPASAAPETAEPAAGEAESDEGGPDVGLDESPELDQQTYEGDDDDFIPTEEIPVGQSIPFPTDI